MDGLNGEWTDVDKTMKEETMYIVLVLQNPRGTQLADLIFSKKTAKWL